jgi:ATP-dependent Clp protease adaptor protein ClpS
MSAAVTTAGAKVQAKTERLRLYKVILRNDDYTPREFVVRVLKAVFRMSEGQAHAVMITAHQRGACVIAVFARRGDGFLPGVNARALQVPHPRTLIQVALRRSTRDRSAD